MIPIGRGEGGPPPGTKKGNGLPEGTPVERTADSSLASPRKAQIRTSLGMTKDVLLFADRDVFRDSQLSTRNLVLGTRYSRFGTSYSPASIFSGSKYIAGISMKMK